MARMILATSQQEYQLAATLFQEYADHIGIDLGFQNFQTEMQQLASQYASPHGALYLIYDPKDQPIGCFAVRKFEAGIAELKRMYLKTSARGTGIGQKMLLKSIRVASNLGYQKMRLDTLPSMKPAFKLYEQAGFYEIPAYRHNPIPEAKFYEIDLNSTLS